jgi:hypothetical protein
MIIHHQPRTQSAIRSHAMTTIPSDDEIILLARQAGLDLPAQFLPELIEAYGNVQRMIERIPTGRPHGDEPAHIFVPTKFMPLGD